MPYGSSDVADAQAEADAKDAAVHRKVIRILRGLKKKTVFREVDRDCDEAIRALRGKD